MAGIFAVGGEANVCDQLMKVHYFLSGYLARNLFFMGLAIYIVLHWMQQSPPIEYSVLRCTGTISLAAPVMPKSHIHDQGCTFYHKNVICLLAVLTLLFSIALTGVGDTALATSTNSKLHLLWDILFDVDMQRFTALAARNENAMIVPCNEDMEDDIQKMFTIANNSPALLSGKTISMAMINFYDFDEHT